MTDEISFQAYVLEGHRVTIPKPARDFLEVDVGDLVNITVTGVKTSITIREGAPDA